MLLARETWSRVQLGELRKRWWHGENAWRIAIALQCNEQTVWRKIRAYGFQRSPAFRPAPRRRLSPTALSDMQAMFERGTASWAIAEKFGLDPGRVVQWARRRGWRRPAGFSEALKTSMRLVLSPKQETRFRAAWSDPAVTFYDMSAEFGGSHPTLCRLAVRLGLPPRHRGTVVRARAASALSYRDGVIARLRAAGASDEVAAAHFGISKSQVKRSVRRSRKRGLSVARLRQHWSPNAADEAAVRDGYRLGLTKSVLARIVGVPSVHNVDGLARRLKLCHRNRSGVAARILAPDVLLAFERGGGDPVDLVQRIYRVCPRAMTEADGLNVLRDYRDAVLRFPVLLGLSIAMRGIEKRKLIRPPSAAIEACRGQFLMIRQSMRLAA